MKKVSLFIPHFYVLAIVLVLSSCQKEQIKDLVPTTNSHNIEELTVSKTADIFEAAESSTFQVISEKDLPEQARILTFDPEKSNGDGDCPYEDYQTAIEQTKAEYQAQANHLCENIFVEVVCCLDENVTYILVRISPVCAASSVITQDVIEG